MAQPVQRHLERECICNSSSSRDPSNGKSSSSSSECEEKQIFKLLIYAVDSAEHGALGPLGAQLYYMCDYTFMECIHSAPDAR
jgi:hypothetical protein